MAYITAELSEVRLTMTTRPGSKQSISDRRLGVKPLGSNASRMLMHTGSSHESRQNAIWTGLHQNSMPDLQINLDCSAQACPKALPAY